MYSGTTLTKYSGRIIGAHQKIDRVAHRHVRNLLPHPSVFPSLKLVLYFEGKNGPDGIKRKSPAKDEPWHYFNPFDEKDSQLMDLLEDHYKQLIIELEKGNKERAAFEAAWLAHGIVDGLTPAHHYPYEEKLVELRGGKGIESRTNIKEKLVMPGDTRAEKLRNNWKMWGAKGLMTTHGMFELGIATMWAPLSFANTIPTEQDITLFSTVGIKDYIRLAAREVAVLDLYEEFYKTGWTPRLAHRVRYRLGPALIRSVSLAWYCAAVEAGVAGDQS
jgi:hypothetical protein